jgi:hypothetical protein
MARRPAARPAMARSADPYVLRRVVSYVYLLGIPFGVLRPDDRAVREIEDALRIAERSGDDVAVAFARMTLGLALVHRQELRSVTADRSSWPRSATCSAPGTQPGRFADRQRLLGA